MLLRKTIQVHGTCGTTSQITPKVQTPPERPRCCPHPARDQGHLEEAAQHHHIRLCLWGKMQREQKKTCCHLNPPASPLASGGEGQEMPREERQGKGIQERTWLTTGFGG